MGTYELRGIGLPVGDYEINTLKLFDSNDGAGICALLRRAGAESTDFDVATSLFAHHPDDMNQRDHAMIAEYRAESGHQYPPLYRIKIVVEVESLTDAETEAAWLAHRDKEPIGLNDDGLNDDLSDDG